MPASLAKEGNPLKVGFEISGNVKETKMTSVQSGRAQFAAKAEVFRIRKFMTFDTIIQQWYSKEVTFKVKCTSKVIASKSLDLKDMMDLRNKKVALELNTIEADTEQAAATMGSVTQSPQSASAGTD